MDELLTVRELAKALKVSARQIWKLHSSGRLPAAVRLARSSRWRAADFSRFIDAGCDMRQFEAQAFAEARG